MSQTYEQFGKYLLLEKVAAGGMAEIYLAKSSAANGLNKFFAIKRILPQFSNNEDFVSMFKEEAKVCINLNHSNVVSIFDFGIENSQFFLVMDYVEGRNLRQIINELKKSNRSFSIDQALYLVKEAAAGLDHAHRCVDATTGKPLNITHRDMSPQNVMVSFEGEIKVIDFGIAKAETEAEDTKAGTLKGKFSYMSPEQAEGQTIDPRTDVFALGIVLWELLANDRLFTGSNEAAILRKVRDCQVPPIRKINPTVPAELERIVMKALAKDRNVRYQTAANFHRDLNRFLNTQYPDFSPQDFSAFIKESFRTSFLEAREKLVTYGKIAMQDPSAILIPTQPVQPKAPPVVTASTSVLAAATPSTPIPASQPPKGISFEKVTLEKDERKPEKNSSAEIKLNEPADPPVAPSGFNSVDVQAKVNLDNIRAANSGNINKNIPSYYQKAGANAPASNQTRVTQVSQVSFARGKQPSKRDTGGDIWLKMSFLIALIGVSYWWVKNMSTQPKSQSVAADTKNAGTNEQASKAPIKVSVNSKPDNAEIWVNGKDSGFKTPAIVSVSANTEVEISVRKDGHLEYTVTKKYTDTINNLVATLQAVPPGYLNIKLAGGDSFTKILINGKELIEKVPIKAYPVVGGKETIVSAYNPITKLTDEVKITVKPDETRDIELVLGRNPASEK